MEENDILDIVNAHYDDKYMRDQNVKQVLEMSNTSQNIDDQELLLSLAGIIKSQGEAIKDLEKRVTLLENPD